MVDDYIIIDLETTSFEVKSGIKEVGMMIIENGNIADKFHYGIVEDENKIHLGKGEGYKIISENKEIIDQFRNVIKKYPYPMVAHNASFDKKFLVYYEWIPSTYLFYDSIKLFKDNYPGLESYKLDKLREHFNIKEEQKHTAFEDVELLWQIIQIIKPEKWTIMGRSHSSYKHHPKPVALHEDIPLVKDLFKGKNIVFSGETMYSRNELIVMGKKYGANIKTSISKKVDYLVIGEEPGPSKMAKAEELNIKIVPIKDFINYIMNN